jgi:hypothetical protein
LILQFRAKQFSMASGITTPEEDSHKHGEKARSFDIQIFGGIINCKEREKAKSKKERGHDARSILFFFFPSSSSYYYYYYYYHYYIIIFLSSCLLVIRDWESISSSFDEEKNFCRLRKIGAVILICLLLLFLLHQRL